MLSWVVRSVLIVAGFIASWLVAKDAPSSPLCKCCGANSSGACRGSDVLARTVDPHLESRW
jgi:hypothetical protein